MQPNNEINLYIHIHIENLKAKFLDFQMAAAEIGDAHTFYEMIQH